MNWLKIRHGRLTPPGLEVKILSSLPKWVFIVSAAIAAVPVITRMGVTQPGLDTAKRIQTVDIFAIATEITVLVAAFTVAIGCIIVHIMKGPAYIADPMEVSHSDEPRSETPSASEQDSRSRDNVTR
ncbi:MAG: hypothetical protein AAFM91_15215 [Pseudomonadota bacterium]